MAIAKDRRLILAVGGAVALAAGLLAAWVLGGRDRNPTQPPPASQAGLQIETGRNDDIKLDPRRPLRCFVGGRLVGELTLSDCAGRNGVASGALDVGLDSSGALAAAPGSTNTVTPLPPPAQAAGEADLAQGTAQSLAPEAQAAPAPCWRYAGGTWNELTGAMSLMACAQSLYDGQCETSGAAAYGRWADRTLRLVEGRIEISRDNRTFRTLVEQGADCSVSSSG
jgi:hypothetical protein